MTGNPAISFASELMILILNNIPNESNNNWNNLVEKFIYSPINLINDDIYLVHLQKVNLILDSVYFSKYFSKLEVYLKAQLLIAPDFEKIDRDSVITYINEIRRAMIHNINFLTKSKSYFPFRHAYILYLSCIKSYQEFYDDTSADKKLLDVFMINLILDPFVTYESEKKNFELFENEHVKPYKQSFGSPLLIQFQEKKDLDDLENKLYVVDEFLDVNFYFAKKMTPFILTVYFEFIRALIKIHQNSKNPMYYEKYKKMDLLQMAINKFIFLGKRAPKNLSDNISEDSLKVFNHEYYKLYKDLSNLVLQECKENKYYLNLQEIKPMQVLLNSFFGDKMCECICKQWYLDLIKENILSFELFESAKKLYEENDDPILIRFINQTLEDLKKYAEKETDLKKYAYFEKFKVINIAWTSFCKTITYYSESTLESLSE